LFLLLFFLKKKKITNYLLDLKKKDKDKGLPKVKINITEKSLNKLLSNVPSSTKQYVKAEFLVNNVKRNIKLRYFGDNPANWMFHHKAFRVKTKKSELINRKRYFEYKPSQRRVLDEYIAYKFAKQLGLLVTEARLVELFVNDKRSGIYIEKENLNESFLRRNKIMPVNLYKGEASRNSEHKIGLEMNLDENPGLWEKISILNSVKMDDYNDLNDFSINVRKAESSNKNLKNLLKFENKDLLARTAILKILLNAGINDHSHNRRILIDVWSGKKHIIPHDFDYNREEINEEVFRLDKCWTRLFCVLNQSSEFLEVKYNLLYKIIREEKIFDKIIADLENLKKNYLISQETDLGVIFRKNILVREYTGPENEESFNQLIVSLKKREKKIISILEKNVKSSWKKNDKGFDIIVHKSIPISNLILKFENEKPNWIILDHNANQIIDEEDKYFYPNIDGDFKIDIKLFANRILVNHSKLNSLNLIETGKTKFTFFTENNIPPSQLVTFNNFTKKKIPLVFKEYKSTTPSLHNKPILKYEKKTNLLKGNIFLKEDLILNEETEILEGTIFTLDEGVSVVYENKVIAIGSKEKPIIFRKNPNSQNWGTIAFHGKKTDGSLFKNIIIENASGKSINGINYFASLSVHSAKNIKFDNILIKNNSKFDDMMHIIYSENIQILNSNFLNAYKDSIDVDISKNILFKNTNIIGSGNDGIDFMESTANLDQMVLISNGDKGISVGENSMISVSNSKFKNNKYGVVSKDSSKAIIEDSLFEDNMIQLSAYQKNWRYGDSGNINIRNSKFLALENKIISDKKGKIKIFDSNIIGKINKTENVQIN